MANRWILCLALVLTIKQSRGHLDPQPGQCDYFGHNLSCNNVTRHQFNTELNNRFFKSITITNSDIGVWDALSIPKKRAAKIEYLSLQGNQITTIQAHAFDNYHNLVTLKLDSNLLSTLPAFLFSNLNSLTRVTIQENRIKTLKTQTFYNLTNLGVIHLNSNPIEKLENNIFSELTAPLYLDLSNTGLDHFPSETFHKVNLYTLVLSGNVITKLNEIENLPGLGNLIVSYNSIESLHADLFVHTPNLVELDLSYNAIDSFSPKRLALPSSVMSLSLNDNALSYLNITEFSAPDLDFLIVDRNPWKCNELPGMVQDASTLNGPVVYFGGNHYDILNYQGIPCVL